MENPFSTQEMAAGYATSRPAVHPRVMEKVKRRLDRGESFEVALDVGCGSGVSTKALVGLARQCIGLEPAEAMVKWASKIVRSAEFVVGAAEAIPLFDRSVDLITAAGSLNYANLEMFFLEAGRVLRPDGVLVVYDFAPGKRFRSDSNLGEWFARFEDRYPPPRSEGRQLSPEILADISPAFRVECQERFEIGLELTQGAYVDYVLTETNVAAAVRNGIAHSEIKTWCAETLATVWSGGEREVVFPGYYACMIATSS